MENSYAPDAGYGVEAEPTDVKSLIQQINDRGWQLYRQGKIDRAEEAWACSETLRQAELKGIIR